MGVVKKESPKHTPGAHDVWSESHSCRGRQGAGGLRSNLTFQAKKCGLLLQKKASCYCRDLKLRQATAGEAKSPKAGPAERTWQWLHVTDPQFSFVKQGSPCQSCSGSTVGEEVRGTGRDLPKIDVRPEISPWLFFFYYLKDQCVISLPPSRLCFLRLQ